MPPPPDVADPSANPLTPPSSPLLELFKHSLAAGIRRRALGFCLTVGGLETESVCLAMGEGGGASGDGRWCRRATLPDYGDLLIHDSR